MATALLFGQKTETPLKAIPYTPSLDIPSMDKSVNPCVDFYHYACGGKFDAQGNLKDWWAPEDARQFQERADCVSDQYSEYTIVDDIKINGKLTMGEDVADLGGTLLAYIAWRHADAGRNLKPIEGFTPDQRFFIGMAQGGCADERPEE